MAVVTERLAVIIGGDAQGAVSAFHRTGKAAAGTDTVVARVTRNIERSFGGLGPILAGAAAVVGPAGVIGAAVAGSGALFAGLGIAAVAGTADVKTAFGDLKTSVVADVKAMAAPIAPVLVGIAGQAESTFAGLKPVIGGAFEDVAPQIDTAATAMLHFANTVVPAVADSVRDGAPVITGLSHGLEDVGTGLAGFLRELDSAAPSAGQALDDLLGDVSGLLPPLGDLIAQVANAAGPVINNLTPAFRIAGVVISDTASAVGLAATVLEGIAGPATKAGLAIGAVVLAVKGLRAIGSGVRTASASVVNAVKAVDTAAGKLATAGVRISESPLRAAESLSRLGLGVRGVATAIPILGGVLAAGGVALDLFARHKAAAKQEVDDFVAAIRADNGALGANTREVAANALEQSGALKAAQSLGVNLQDVTDAAIGNTDAMARVTAQLKPYDTALDAALTNGGHLAGVTGDQAEAMHTLRDVLAGTNVKVKDAVDSSKRQAAASGEASTAAGGLAKTADAAGVSMLGEKSAADQLRDSLDLLNGKNISAAEGAVSFQNNVAGLQQSLKDNGATLDIHTQKGRDNTTAFLDAARSASDYADAVVNQTGDQASANKILSDARTQLINVAVQSGLTKGEAQKLVDQYLRIPDSVTTKLVAEAETAAARKKLDDLNNKLNNLHNRTVTVNVRTIYSNPGTAVRTSGGRVGRASGGAVEAGVPVLVGEHRPEVFMPSSSGTIRPTAAGANSGGPAYQITNHITLTGGDANADGISRAIAWSIRTAGG